MFAQTWAKLSCVYPSLAIVSPFYDLGHEDLERSWFGILGGWDYFDIWKVKNNDVKKMRRAQFGRASSQNVVYQLFWSDVLIIIRIPRVDRLNLWASSLMLRPLYSAMMARSLTARVMASIFGKYTLSPLYVWDSSNACCKPISLAISRTSPGRSLMRIS